MTEARVPVTDDALVQKVAAALETAWNQSRDLPPIDFVQREREELANAVIAIAYPAGVAAGREEAAKVADERAAHANTLADGPPPENGNNDIRVACGLYAESIAAAIRQRGE